MSQVNGNFDAAPFGIIRLMGLFLVCDGDRNYRSVLKQL